METELSKTEQLSLETAKFITDQILIAQHDFDPDWWDIVNHRFPKKGSRKAYKRKYLDAIEHDLNAFALGGLTKYLRLYVDDRTRSISFDWNITLKGVGSPYRKHIDNIPLPYFEEIKTKRSDLFADFIDVRTELVQTMNPFIIQDKFRLARGETVKATVSKISAERLVCHAPTIFDLIHYFQKHKGDDTRVKMDDVDGQTVVVLKAKSIYELLTVKGGGAKMNAKEELKKLQETPFHLVYETESSNRRKSGEGEYVARPIGESFSSFIYQVDINQNNGNITLWVHAALLSIEQHAKKLPADLRERWNKWNPRRMEQYHFNAAAWSWMQRQHFNEWTVDKLLDVWGIKPDKKDPKRMWQRFTSCIAFLMLTNEIRSYNLITTSSKNVREARKAFENVKGIKNINAKGIKNMDVKDKKNLDQWLEKNFCTDDVRNATHVLFRMDRTTHPLIKGEMKTATIPFE